MCIHQPFTVLPAKSDSDVMFCLHSYRGLIIDRNKPRKKCDHLDMTVAVDWDVKQTNKNICRNMVRRMTMILTLCLLLLITFANCNDPDQDRQSVGPDLDANCLTL